MLNTKFDLYKTEWLDLVFDDRNKAYGAYDLRHHYAGTLNKAMGIAFTVVISTAVVFGIGLKSKNAGVIHEHIIQDIPILPPPPVKNEKVEPPVKAEPAKPQPKVTTTQHLPPVVTSDDKAVNEPVKNNEIKGAVGSETVKGEDDAENLNIPEPVNSGGGGTAEPAPSNEPMSTFGLEVQPEPFGGMAAFSKFLGKNLRFPGVAQDAGIQGRVILGFIIERDGSLSNITVERKAGYGFDEEAVRVLKLAKAWKPGIQNGRPVRVKYNIPINFTISE